MKHLRAFLAAEAAPARMAGYRRAVKYFAYCIFGYVAANAATLAVYLLTGLHFSPEMITFGSWAATAAASGSKRTISIMRTGSAPPDVAPILPAP